MTPKLVTVAIPIYRRLNYLPGVLKAVESQDYPHIELIVSDNGKNGSRMTDIIEKSYSRPVRVRQTTTTVNIPAHYHQCLAEATGEYFVWLADDDLISPNFVSELVQTLEAHPQAMAAIAHEEIIDPMGRVIRESLRTTPSLFSGEELIRSWNTYKYENYSTLLARTEDIVKCGGYAHTAWGTASDDILLMKLCLQGPVAFNQRCTFQYRWDAASFGFAISIYQLAEDYRQLLRMLEEDPIFQAYGTIRPDVWAELKQGIIRMTWREYYYRWNNLYRQRLHFLPWLKAAFAVRFPLAYYGVVLSSLRWTIPEMLIPRIKTRWPGIHKLYRWVKFYKQPL